jgi:hypothetical protein
MTKQPADQEAARELALFAINDGALYHDRSSAAILNLARKRERGTYDHDRSVKLWRYVADEAARLYTKAHDSSDAGTFGIFTPATRDMTAVELRDHYYEQVAEAGEG